jgi:hypothetical protein
MDLWLSGPILALAAGLEADGDAAILERREGSTSS